MKFETITEKQGLHDIPWHCVPVYYFDAFNLLYHFENSLRLFIYSILKSELRENWFNTKIREDKDLTILNTYKHRKKELENYGHIGRLPKVPLLYLTLDELVSIMLSESLRRLFKPHFPASLEKVYKTKLWELIILRNTLVHFRQFTKQDFKRLLSNLEDLAPPIGGYVDRLIGNEHFDEYHPTKKDKWYSSWMSLSLKTRSFSGLFLSKSKCQQWIRLILDVKTIKKEFTEGLYYCNIRFNKMIDFIRGVLPETIYFKKEITPESPDMGFNKSEKCGFFCFHLRYFQSHYEDIFSLFIDLIDNIEDEFKIVMDEEKYQNVKKSLKYIECRSKDYQHSEIQVSDYVEDWSVFSDWGDPWGDFSSLTGKFPWLI